MPDKPAADVAIDSDLVRFLLAAQAACVIPDAATLPLEKIAEGWDSEVWRLGEGHAVRLPRRALAAPLVLHEQRVLPGIARRLESTGVRVPAPIVEGTPQGRFPWAWSVVPWIPGIRGMDVPRSHRAAWAPTLARALAALHTTAPADHPVNPVRGRALHTRDESFRTRLDALVAAGTLDARTAGVLEGSWAAGLSAAPWTEPPVWIHGDLHPGNLVADAGRLTGIIDFGDVTAGDPAYDLAVAWLAFDATSRRGFIAATEGRYDESTWRRAHAWAGAIAVVLLTHSDDAPDYAALAREATLEVLADAPAWAG